MPNKIERDILYAVKCTNEAKILPREVLYEKLNAVILDYNATFIETYSALQRLTVVYREKGIDLMNNASIDDVAARERRKEGIL